MSNTMVVHTPGVYQLGIIPTPLYNSVQYSYRYARYGSRYMDPVGAYTYRTVVLQHMVYTICWYAVWSWGAVRKSVF